MISRAPDPDHAPASQDAAPHAPEAHCCGRDDSAPSLLGLSRELRVRLETLRALGWQVPLALRPEPAPAAAPRRPRGGPRAAPARPADPPAPRDAPAPASRVESPARVAPAAALDPERAHRQALLDEIDREVVACRECQLCFGRTQTVFGVGDPCARLMFVGEGPGYDEDLQGEPFVGRAGQLLDRMIAAMGLERREVYIANIVKCRPPGNRRPEPAEASACLGFLRRQIAVVRPAALCTLGATPLRWLLGRSEGIRATHGQVLQYEGIPVVPTFHPAYLLRTPQDKRLAWADLQTVMGLLASRPPPPTGR